MTTTDISVALERDARALAEGARTLSRGAGQASQEFEMLLQRVLSRGDPDESDVIARAIDLLYEKEDEQSVDWLLTEIEIESELQYITLGKGGREKACLLFAIPVLLPAFSSQAVPMAQSIEFEALHDVLSDAGIVGDQADFRLLPKLFSHEELRGRPYGDFMRLARELGCQLMEPGASAVYADASIFPPPAVQLPKDPATPYVDLRFLLGIAVTTHEGLEYVFPPLDNPDEEGDSSEEGDTEGHDAEEQEGAWWQVPFIEALENWTGTMLGVLDVAAPVGFHEDLRFGQELLREWNCKLQLESAMANAGLGIDEVALSEVPYAEEGTEVAGIRLTLLDTEDEDVDELVWHCLAHESLDDAIDKLHVLLSTMGFAAADELFSCDAPNASYLLH